MLDHIDLRTRQPRNSTIDQDALQVAMRGGGVPEGAAVVDLARGTYVTAYPTSLVSQLVAPNRLNRTSLILFNDSDGAVFMRLGSTAVTTSNFSIRIAAGSALTMSLGEYNGAITAIWGAAAIGNLRVTEVL